MDQLKGPYDFEYEENNEFDRTLQKFSKSPVKRTNS
jgi:hypothetical protein